jgi:hypothetical protein
MAVLREREGEKIVLVLGYPGRVGLPPAGAPTTEILSYGVESVPGSPGRVVKAGGFALLRMA